MSNKKEVKNGINLQTEKVKIAGGVITQDPDTGKWWVFGENYIDDTMRVFKTHEEAIEWAKERGYSTEERPFQEVMEAEFEHLG